MDGGLDCAYEKDLPNVDGIDENQDGHDERRSERKSLGNEEQLPVLHAISDDPGDRA
jgi:hypothetical protein